VQLHEGICSRFGFGLRRNRELKVARVSISRTDTVESVVPQSCLAKTSSKESDPLIVFKEDKDIYVRTACRSAQKSALCQSLLPTEPPDLIASKN
jgi:hypothetical protein